MENLLSKLMIVDDSPQDIHMLLTHVGGLYQVTAATSPMRALEMMRSESPPDIVLLDISMPDMDGYEACRQMKEDPALKDIDVIFVSANDSTEEIIHGLEVGAIDYVVKPFDPKVVQSKIRRVLQYRRGKKELMKQAMDANKMIYSVMSESGYTGIAMTFLRSLFEVSNPADLLSAAVNSIEEYGLSGAIYCKYKSIEQVAASGGNISSLEMELMQRMLRADRPIYEQGARLIMAKRSAVMFIRNFPADEFRRGTLRDSLMILLDGVDEKLKLLYAQYRFKEQNEELKSLVRDFNGMLADVRLEQEKHKKAGVAILDEMVAKIEKMYFSLGLTEIQEDRITEVLRDAMDKSLDHLESGLSLDKDIEKIVTGLSALIEKDH